LLYLMKQVELAVRPRLDDMLRPTGLTALQYTAMTVLEGHPDLTASQLARRSFVTAQTMADMVTALLGRDLIERHRDPAVDTVQVAVGRCFGGMVIRLSPRRSTTTQTASHGSSNGLLSRCGVSESKWIESSWCRS
jgi:hypothetical protein